ncbi:hypothetical protein TcarDRAFT_2435 [Thermosinus carboxydivorans Nor1]|uniref:Uncharacterized protein n=1 Tax=Thermosinus carboxydivorans Nor1 TaxID=401526 RepID=A1HNP5_9FIRM|nr:hypothetical protein [Thermosinus carboxydivorans]EAX48485.1 hypothetical protein TcarDRAFT_2435 [Thermosinus carboxydivorans Nor1]
MPIPHEAHNKQKVDISRKPMLTARWIVLPMFILILFSVGIFANYHQALSANAVATTELRLNQQKESGQAQENKKNGKKYEYACNHSFHLAG